MSSGVSWTNFSYSTDIHEKVLINIFRICRIIAGLQYRESESLITWCERIEKLSAIDAFNLEFQNSQGPIHRVM